MMKKILSLFLILFVSLSMVMTEAHAKRFGGGRSFGAYRAPSSFSRTMPSATPRMNNPLQNRSWLGPLAGLALGGLLASLFMGNGVASGIMSWLLVAGVIFLIMNLVRSFMRPKMATTPSSSIYQMQREQPIASSHQPFAASFASSKPAGFDEQEFLRIAKVQFIRLQAAFDKKNLADLNQFTTPEVFAEIKMQLQERGDNDNQTDVVTLNAKLLDVASERQGVIASVEFSGMIKEDLNQPAASFTEIWHFEQDANGQWLMAGLQQG